MPWCRRTLSGTTGVDGVAHLRAAPYGHAGIAVETTSPGYLFENKTLTVEAVQAIEPPSFFGDDPPRPVCFVVEMYAEPHPSVELVVPAGYRGLIKAEMQFRDDAPCTPGQRTFTYEVQPSGSARSSARPCSAASLLQTSTPGPPTARLSPVIRKMRISDSGGFAAKAIRRSFGSARSLSTTTFATPASGRVRANQKSHPRRSPASRGGHHGGKGNPFADQSGNQATPYPDSSGMSP